MIEGWYTEEELRFLAAIAGRPDLPSGDIVEVGVAGGRSAWAFTQATKGTDRQLVLIDDRSLKEAPLLDPFVERHPRVRYLEVSTTAFKRIVNWPIAILHLDDGHMLEDVLPQLRLFGPLVVPGGYIILHDWEPRPQTQVIEAWNAWGREGDFINIGTVGICRVWKRKQ
jgi:hypothetical protein